MLLGVGAAVGWYLWLARRLGQASPHSWTILLSALFFGSLGAKLMSVALVAGQYPTFGFIQFLYSGRSIIGGLLGGWLGVVLVKRVLGLRARQGNLIAPAAALGIAVGRIGCLLGSCCYGKPTSLPVGIDFGDGQFRHPTQVYEALFALGLFIYFNLENAKHPAPGILFQRFLLAYFSFRFLVGFLRTEPDCWLGLGVFQLFSLVAVALLLWRGWRSRRERQQLRHPLSA